MITASADDVSHCEIFRTYRSPQSTIHCTLMEALCASLAVPPLFDPVSIGPRLQQQRFIGGALGFYNPIREMVKEAKAAYGDDQRVALILSLGAGISPVVSINAFASISVNIETLVKYIGTDCERVAREMASQLIQVDAYVRLNVSRGLERVQFYDWSCINSIESSTITYLEAASVSRTVDVTLEKITKRIGSITAGQLSMTTSLVTDPALLTLSQIAIQGSSIWQSLFRRYPLTTSYDGTNGKL
jgi:hypothetical protein